MDWKEALTLAGIFFGSGFGAAGARWLMSKFDGSARDRQLMSKIAAWKEVKDDPQLGPVARAQVEKLMPKPEAAPHPTLAGALEVFEKHYKFVFRYYLVWGVIIIGAVVSSYVWPDRLWQSFINGSAIIAPFVIISAARDEYHSNKIIVRLSSALTKLKEQYGVERVASRVFGEFIKDRGLAVEAAAYVDSLPEPDVNEPHGTAEDGDTGDSK